MKKNIKTESIIHWKLENNDLILGSLTVDPIKFLKKENNLYFFETKNHNIASLDERMLDRVISRYECLKLDTSILMIALNASV